MAKVSHTYVLSSNQIDPGQTEHYKWNNAPSKRVWSFSVDPEIYGFDAPPPGDFVRVEITRVEYRLRNSTTKEREIHFWVKNTGKNKARYKVYMASVRE